MFNCSTVSFFEKLNTFWFTACLPVYRAPRAHPKLRPGTWQEVGEPVHNGWGHRQGSYVLVYFLQLTDNSTGHQLQDMVGKMKGHRCPLKERGSSRGQQRKEKLFWFLVKGKKNRKRQNHTLDCQSSQSNAGICHFSAWWQISVVITLQCSRKEGYIVVFFILTKMRLNNYSWGIICSINIKAAVKSVNNNLKANKSNILF